MKPADEAHALAADGGEVVGKWCPSCNGAGWTADVASWKPVKCPDCAGSGLGEHSISANEAATPPADAEQRARKLLAAEYVRDGKYCGQFYGNSDMDDSERRAIRAIVAALTQQPEPVPEARGVVDAYRRGFVDGAKWWEWEKAGATMWQSDQQRAYDKATENLAALAGVRDVR